MGVKNQWAVDSRQLVPRGAGEGAQGLTTPGKLSSQRGSR